MVNLLRKLNNDIFLESILYIHDDTFFKIIDFYKNGLDKLYLLNSFFSNQQNWTNEVLFFDLIEKRYFDYILIFLEKNKLNDDILYDDHNRKKFIYSLDIIIQYQQLSILNYFYNKHLIRDDIHLFNIESSIKHESNNIYDYLIEQKSNNSNKIIKKNIIEQSLFYSNEYVYKRYIKENNISLEDELDQRKNIYFQFKKRISYNSHNFFPTIFIHDFRKDTLNNNKILNNNSYYQLMNYQFSYYNDNKLKYFLNYYKIINEYNKLFIENNNIKINEFYKINDFFISFIKSPDEKHILTLLENGFLRFVKDDDFADKSSNSFFNSIQIPNSFNLLNYAFEINSVGILTYIIKNKKEYYDYMDYDSGENNDKTFEKELKQKQREKMNFGVFKVIHEYYPYEFDNDLLENIFESYKYNKNKNKNNNHNNHNDTQYLSIHLFFQFIFENLNNTTISIFDKYNIKDIIYLSEYTTSQNKSFLTSESLFEYICKNYYYLIQNDIENSLINIMNDFCITKTFNTRRDKNNEQILLNSNEGYHALASDNKKYNHYVDYLKEIGHQFSPNFIRLFNKYR